MYTPFYIGINLQYGPENASIELAMDTNLHII